MSITETEKEKSKKDKIIIGTVGSFCVLLIIYFSMAQYFKTHFYFGSAINGIDVSAKTMEEANEKMKSKLEGYSLLLKERNGKSEQIKGVDIELKYNSGEQLKNLKNNQNPYKWGLGLFNTEDCKMTVGMLYNTKLLREEVDKLSCFNSKNIVEPKNPDFKYTGKEYVIVDEIKGCKVDKNILYNNVVNAISKEEDTIDLEEANCYVKPKYTKDSPKVIEDKNILNKYVASKITYVFEDSKKSIDSSVINEWLTVDEDFEIIFDDKKIKNYMKQFFDAYNTVGKMRNFSSSSGRMINVSGGDYGWNINTDKEITDLMAAIKEGKTMIKEPAYLQTAVCHGKNDIGNTYVEINMTKQHLWFYKNGSLVAQGDVVTGNVSNNHSTPEGIYKLKYKERNAILKGQGYSSPVNFWMPFNNGIGIHDASWRSQFGGNIYRTSGSHGCINSPYNLAKTIFDNIDEGTPVVCYYDKYNEA